MTAKNYFFIADCVPTEKERKECEALADKYVYVNAKYGSTFNREVNKVAGLVPDHLIADKEQEKQPADESFDSLISKAGDK